MGEAKKGGKKAGHSSPSPLRVALATERRPRSEAWPNSPSETFGLVSLTSEESARRAGDEGGSGARAGAAGCDTEKTFAPAPPPQQTQLRHGGNGGGGECNMKVGAPYSWFWGTFVASIIPCSWSPAPKCL